MLDQAPEIDFPDPWAQDLGVDVGEDWVEVAGYHPVAGYADDAGGGEERGGERDVGVDVRVAGMGCVPG